MSPKKRFFILSVSAAAVLALIPATAGAASSAKSGETATAHAVPFTVKDNPAGTGLVLVPVPGVAQTSKVYDGLTATSPTAHRVPDSDGAKLAAAGKVVPATESTTFVQTGPFAIYSQYNGNCLDADTNTINANGTKVQLWACLGDENQNWYEDNYGTYARIWNEDQHRYLDADTNTLNKNGTKVQLWDYVDGNTNQWWVVNGDGTIVNQDPAATVYTTLDADLNTINANGTIIQLWQTVGGQNQYWY